MARQSGWSPRRIRAWTDPVRRAMAFVLPDVERGAVQPAAHPGDWLVAWGVYAEGERLAVESDLAGALAAAQQHDGFVWLGVLDPTQEQFEQVAEAFKLDELLVEKAVTVRHRPRVERLGDVTLFVLRTTGYIEHPALTESSEIVETGEVLIFLGDRFVITVRHGAPGQLAEVRAEIERRPDRLAWGPWSVAYAICDHLVDSYLDVADRVETDLEALEEEVFARATGDNIAHIYQLKRELMEFKRAVNPLQRPMAALLDDREVAKEVRRYFRDLNDHLLRVVERIASYDDLLNSILQARLAQVSVSQNNDMRKIAAWAAIAGAQTAIAGVYGMNFDFMPELRWHYGYYGVLAFMALTGYALYRGFKRTGWL